MLKQSKQVVYVNKQPLNICDEHKYILWSYVIYIFSRRFFYNSSFMSNIIECVKKAKQNFERPNKYEEK